MSLIDPAAREQYEQDGVCLLRGILSAEDLERLEQAYQFTFEHPGPGARALYPEDGGRFYQDGSNMENWDYYAALLKEGKLPEICRELWGSHDVWFMNEQVFLKEGGHTRRTPWHQDASYTPYDGAKLAIMWINFDPVAKEDSLEFVRGSHKRTIYSGPAFDPGDDTAPLTPTSTLPRMPDIERERDRWDIISFAVDPGDVVVFHNRTLHGGGATSPNNRRRTLSLRFFGNDVIRVSRDDRSAEKTASQLDPGLMSGWGGLVKSLTPGQALSTHEAFRRL